MNVLAALVHETLVLYAEDEPADRAVAVAAALPKDGDRLPVVCTPAVSARADLFDLLPDLFTDHLGGLAEGVRLVPLGPYADASSVPALAGRFASELGVDLAVPLTAPARFPDGTPSAAEWILVGDGEPVRERPGAGWSTVPAANGFSLVRVDSGYTPVPPPVEPSPPADAPEPVPSEVDPPIGRRIPGGWSFSALPESPAAPGFLVVEVEADDAGFRLDNETAEAKTLARYVEGLAPGLPVVLRAAEPHPDGPVAELARELGRPVIAADDVVLTAGTGLLTTTGVFRRWLPGASEGTEIGRVLPPRPGPAPQPPAQQPSVVRVAGFSKGPDRSPSRPESLLPPAEPVESPAVVDVLDQPTQPLGPMKPAEPAQRAAAEPVRGLAAVRTVALDQPTLSLARPATTVEPLSEATAEPLSEATAETGAEANAAVPKRAIAVLAAQLDTVLAERATAPAVPSATLLLLPAVEHLVPAEPAHRAEPRALPEPGRIAVPLLVDGLSLTADDRIALRRILTGRYDGHSRIAASMLSEEPGLRVAALTAPDLLGGLVAVRAYCSTDRDEINGALRGSSAEDPARLARWVAYGLRRLPAVFGPVFRSARTLPLDAYRPGSVLVEPAFLDAEPARSAVDDGGLVIWSAGARRVGRLAPHGLAVFPAGTHFEVLAAEEEPARVFLRELPGGRPANDGGARTLERLREAAAPASETVPGQTPVLQPLGFALGHDDHGRAYEISAADDQFKEAQLTDARPAGTEGVTR